jgi:hypothetical protein
MEHEVGGKALDVSRDRLLERPGFDFVLLIKDSVINDLRGGEGVRWNGT